MGCCAGGDIKHRFAFGQRHRVGEGGFQARGLVHQFGEIVASIGARNGSHSFGCQDIGHVLHDGIAQQATGAVIKFDKLRGNPGLQRKATKQHGAKGMDGLDAQTTRRIYCGGKKLTRLGQVFSGGLIFAKAR